MSYADRNRKTILLPSGAAVQIRKMTARDTIHLARIPNPLLQPKTDPGEEHMAERLETYVSFAKIALTQCTGRLVFEGKAERIVDKPFNECGEGEVSLDLIDQTDAERIVSEVMAFSGFGTAAEAAAPFSGVVAADGPGTSPGEVVSLPTDGSVGAAAG